MTYDEFMDIVVESNPEDWIYDGMEKFVLKNDLLISIIGNEVDYDESGRFYEDWATNFPDQNARKKQFSLCYGCNEIDTLYTAMVDGARMCIPYPKLEDMTISTKDYRLGKIVNMMNEGYGFESYLQRANITVK